MKVKRVLVSILCVAMVLGTMNFNVFAEDQTSEDFGTITPCYTDANSFWGEATSNSTESLVVELYEGETKIASTSLNDVGGIINGDVYVTWNINFGENNDEYWNVEWAEGYPKYDMSPTLVKLFADGVEVAENDVRFNGPDNLNKIVAIAEGFTGGVVAYKTLDEAIGDFNGRKVNVVRDVTESIESFNGCTLTTNVEGGVTVTSTYDDWIYANDFNIGSGVTVKAGNLFYDTDGVNTIEGTLEVAETFYHGYDAKTTVDNGGRIDVDGTTILRYNETADAGLYIYGDDDDSTIEFDCDYYIGAYSGTFYAEDANIQTGYFLLKNSYDDDNYANVGLTLDNSSIKVVGTTDTQDSFIIDDKASVTLKNGSVIEDVRDFSIFAGADLTLNIDGSSSIKATNVSVAEGLPFETVDNGDETLGIKKVLIGQGTAADPYQINNIDDLKLFRDKVDEQASDGASQFTGKYIKLNADIDLDEDGDGIGENWNPIGSMAGDHGSFKGVFDGNGHTISNLNVQTTGNGLGFFAYTTGNAEIKNLTFNNVTVKSTNNSNYVGGVVGNAFASTKITNVHITGKIDISGRGYIGGIVGHGYVVIDNSSVKAEGTINSTFWCAGGMVGYAGEGTTNVKNSIVEGTGNGLVIRSAAGGLGSIVGMAEDNNGTQPIAGSNLVAKNILIQTYIGAYGNSYAEYALGYVYGGNPTSILTNITIENITFDAQGNSNPPVSDIAASVDGLCYTSLENALDRAKEMTGPVEINLLGNTITPTKAIVIENDENFIIKDGTIDLTNIDATASGFVDEAGIYAVPFTVMGKLTLDNAKIVGRNVIANQGIVVIGSAGELTLVNAAEINLTDVDATAVIYGDGANPKLTMEVGTKLVYDGDNNGTETRGILSVEFDIEESTIVLKNLDDNALRNVAGNIVNSTIIIDGVEYGIKNTVECDKLTVAGSKITVINAQNSTDNAGIYLTGREKLADTNSVIDSIIYIEGGAVYNTLTFETNGGNLIPSVTDKEVNSVVDLSAYRPEKTGYTFAGWYSDAGLTQSISSVILDDAKTVYAKWNANVTYGGGSGVTNYTITFNTNGGSAISKVVKNKNDIVDLANYVSEKEGYNFEGWYIDKELSHKITSIKLIKNITIYAKWVEDISDRIQMLTDKHCAYIFGRDGGYIYPNAETTRAEVATIFFRLLTEEVRKESLTKENEFGDVAADEWYNTAISTLTQLEILNGRTEKAFEPDAFITRAEFTTIAARFSNGVYKGESFFKDIDGHWAKEYINTAANLGWIIGENGSFRPDDNITRAEVMTLVNRVLNRVPESKEDLLDGMITWKDNSDENAWYYLAVQEATNSHNYEIKADGVCEKWIKLTDSPDWTKFEK